MTCGALCSRFSTERTWPVLPAVTSAKDGVRPMCDVTDTTVIDSGVPYTTRVETLPDGRWRIIVSPRRSGGQSPQQALAAIESALQRPTVGAQPFPAIDEGTPIARQFTACAAFAGAARRVGSSGFFFLTLIAIRSGALRWDEGQWRGATKLLQVYPGVASKADLSKAATVLLNELPQLLSPAIGATQAMRELAEWLGTNSWTTAYDNFKTDR
jgi:hypothetical protein